MPEVIAEWMGPAGVAIVFAGLIWLIQHNVLLIHQQKDLARHDKAINDIESDHKAIVSMMERITMRLDLMDQRHEKAELQHAQYERRLDEGHAQIEVLKSEVQNLKNRGAS